MANLIGQSLGQYKILSLLGTGGMAAVYRAHQASIERDVALKVIRPQLSELESFIVRFRREAKLVASLSHPHIVKVFDYGQFEDMAYLVMELLTGGSLAQIIRKGPLSLEITGKMLDQIASALDFAHQSGIIHRDLKPQNVLLDANQNAFLTDFGIAKIVEDNAHLTQSGTVMGTPAYMSPEQWSGQDIDGRADIYALGVMLFEMLTGRLPFDGNTPFLLMHQHIYETPRSVSEVNDNVPPALASVLNQALAKDRADRFNTAGELAAAFKAAVSGMPVPETKIKSPTRPMGAAQKEAITVPVPARNDKTEVVAPAPVPPPTTPARSSQPLIFGLVGGAGAVVVVAVVLVLLLSKGQSPMATPTPTIVALIASTEAGTVAATGSSQSLVAVVTSASTVPSVVPTIVPSATNTLTMTLTPTTTLTATTTLVPTLIPTLTLTSTVDDEGTLNAAVQLTSTGIVRAAQLSTTIAQRLTQTEQAKPTATFTPSNTPTETWTPTKTPTETLTPSETWTPKPTNTNEPTTTPGPTNTDSPSATPAPISIGLGTIAMEFGSEGTGLGHFQDLRFIAVDSSGNIYTGEYSSGRIQKFDGDGKFITSWIPDGKSPLRGLTVGRNGNVFLVRSGQILKYDGTGKLLKTFGDLSSFYDDVALLPDGNLLVAVTNASNNDIVKINANTGAEMAHFTNGVSSQTGSAELDVRLTSDGLGTIYALGVFSDAVFVFNASGKFQNRFGSFLAPSDVSVDAKSRVFVTDFGTINVFDQAGAAIGTIKPPNNQAFQTAIDDNGYMYMASRDRVYKVKLNLP